MGYIYIIKNSINDKVYIGQTIGKIEARWKQHLANDVKTKSKLGVAFNELGITNFYVGKLLECSNTELDKYEIYYIQKYDSFNNGYNATTGGRFIGTNYRVNKTLEKVQGMFKSGYTKEDISIKLNISKGWMCTLGKFDSNNKTYYGNNKKSVIAFDIINNEIVKVCTFESIRQAFMVFSALGLCANNMGNFYSRVKESCKRYNIAFGYRWMYESTDVNNIDISNIKGLRTKIKLNVELNKCKYCGKDTSNKSSVCNSCTQVIAKGKILKPSREELINLLESGLIVKDIAEIYDRSNSTISYWLSQYKIKYITDKRKSIKNRQPVYCIDLQVEFTSYRQAAIYLDDNGYVHNKDYGGVAYRLSKAIANNKNFAGLSWELK